MRGKLVLVFLRPLFSCFPIFLFPCSFNHVQVLAIDNDAGENGRVTYAIKSGKGKAKFRIHPDTGVIYAAKVFEPDTEYDLAIRAEDNGQPKRSQTIRVNVVVVPIPKESEHPPVIKMMDQKVDVTENDRPGYFVALIQATDDDNDQLWYDIVGEYMFDLYTYIHHNIVFE